MIIVVTEPNEIHKDALKLLKEHDYTVVNGTKLTKAHKNAADALFIRTYTTVDARLLAQFPRVRCILRAGVGLDTIDLEECKKRNIQVINSPGANANAVAEFVVSVMIMLLRSVIPQMQELKAGYWRNKQWIGEELKGKTIGLIGCGAIGRRIVELLQPFRVDEILGFDPYIERAFFTRHHIKKHDLGFLLRHADIISLHLPLVPETKHLISDKEVSFMKRTAYLINTSRGGIVDEEALISALQKKQIRGAALDVFEHEPKIRKTLLSLPNLLATPHIAGYTKEADRTISVIVVKRFLELLSSQPVST